MLNTNFILTRVLTVDKLDWLIEISKYVEHIFYRHTSFDSDFLLNHWAMALCCMCTPKTLTGRSFVILLAVVDLLCCVIILPQVPLWELGFIDVVYVSQVLVQVLVHLFIQVAMTLDRVFAVFTPFRYQQYRRTSRTCLAVLATFIIIGLQIKLVVERIFQIDAGDYIGRATFFVTYTIGVLVIFTSYPVLAMRLFRMKRKVAPQQHPHLLFILWSMATQLMQSQKLNCITFRWRHGRLRLSLSPCTWRLWSYILRF